MSIMLIFDRTFLAVVFLSVVCTTAYDSPSKKPNIIFVLTDDQDVVLNGEIPIEKTRKLIGEKGIIFENMFVTNPLCCPSRSSILTGRYTHNHNALNNSISGNCSSRAWQNNAEKSAFAPFLKKLGYHTLYAGKYLNQYGTEEAGGPEHIPPGWDEWYGLIGNSRYYNYAVSNNGKREKHGSDPKNDYFTTQIAKRAQRFLSEHVQADTAQPFFMMLATPACHGPFTPEPHYQSNFSDVKAPRNGSFNVYGKDKHWLIRQAKNPMSNKTLQVIDRVFVNRWRTLLTVDDMIESLVTTLQQQKILDNTYIFFSSDNGYHLGQLSMPIDKRQLYEFDIRVPLMVRGPGIQSGQVRQEVIINLDFAPTFIDLAGFDHPPLMDGQSMKELLLSNQSQGESWRTDFMVEHAGEYTVRNEGCPQLTNQSVSNCEPDCGCICEDSKNNTYLCVRSISSKENLVYCEFQDHENFIEVYDLSKDPYQLTNIVHTIDPSILVTQNQRLVSLAVCEGASCKRQIQPWPPS